MSGLRLAPWVLGAAVILATGGCAGGWRRAQPAPAAPASGAKGEPAAPTRTGESDALGKRVEAHARFAAGVVRSERGEMAQAEEEFARSVAADLANEPLVIELANRWLQEQQGAQAVDLLSRSAARPDASGMLHGWLGMALAEQGKTNRAVAEFRTAIKKAPQSLMGYHGLAQLYLRNKQPATALKVLDEAAGQNDASPAFLTGLAEFLAAANRTKLVAADEAKPRVLVWLERVARANPTQPFVLQKMADTYKAVGELARAAALYEELLQRRGATDPAARPILREQLVRFYLASGEKQKAAQQLKEILRETPTAPNAYLLLGALAADEKRYAEAADYYEKAILMNEDLEAAYFDLAGMRLATGQSAGALEILARARARFGAGFLVEFYSGVAQSGLREYAEALKHFTSAELLAKASDPTRLNHLFYFQVGAAYERMANRAFAEGRDADGRRHGADAETGLRRAIELSPDSAEALNYLGYMWAERGTNLVEARQMIEQALKLEPDSAAYLDSLAWVLYQSQQAGAALEPMLRAIKLSEEPDVTLYEHLGDIYAALGRTAEARDAWTKAIEIWQTLPEAARKSQPIDPTPAIRRKRDALP